jgi:ferrous iron transport protein B
MELPPYKRPLLRVVMRHMWDRSKIFLRRAGTVILGINIILWFLATYPKSSGIESTYDRARAAEMAKINPQLKDEAVAAAIDDLKSNPHQGQDPVQSQVLATIESLDKEEAGEKLRNSFAGRMGHAIEPIIAPLGFDWKMGIGIIGAFAAREVFVSTMSTVYNVGNEDTAASRGRLEETLREQKREDGTPVYTVRTAITLMVFYVFALQCVSTVAVVRRETNSWKWPLFQWVYMGVLAWGFAFAATHIGRLLGW